jgi:hypothetical protein
MHDDPGTRRPRHLEVSQTEAALPGHVDERDGELAEAVRAAAAGIQGELTPAAYAEFRERDPERWPRIEEIEERFGSLTVALAEAGVDVPGRS